jgi:predicted  nucleic acid-binding Zn ribbon protein
VRERHELAALELGGSSEHPIAVGSASVVEVRVGRLDCPLCGGEYQLIDHRAPMSGIRQVHVRCTRCRISRELWFRLVSNEAN